MAQAEIPRTLQAFKVTYGEEPMTAARSLGRDPVWREAFRTTSQLARCIFDLWDNEDKKALVHWIAGDHPAGGEAVWELANDRDGTWLVQNVIMSVPSQDLYYLLADGFRSRVRMAWQSRYANHVLLQLIQVLFPKDASFVLEQVADSCREPSLDHPAVQEYGCRIVQCALEQLDGESFKTHMDILVSWIEEHILKLCVHTYGSYVVQRSLERLERRRVEIAVAMLRRLVADPPEYQVEGIAAALPRGGKGSRPRGRGVERPGGREQRIDVVDLANVLLGSFSLQFAMEYNQQHWVALHLAQLILAHTKQIGKKSRFGSFTLAKAKEIVTKARDQYKTHWEDIERQLLDGSVAWEDALKARLERHASTKNSQPRR